MAAHQPAAAGLFAAQSRDIRDRKRKAEVIVNSVQALTKFSPHDLLLNLSHLPPDKLEAAMQQFKNVVDAVGECHEPEPEPERDAKKKKPNVSFQGLYTKFLDDCLPVLQLRAHHEMTVILSNRVFDDGDIASFDVKEVHIALAQLNVQEQGLNASLLQNWICQVGVRIKILNFFFPFFSFFSSCFFYRGKSFGTSSKSWCSSSTTRPSRPTWT